MDTRLHRLIPAIVTPFRTDLRLDERVFTRYVEKVVSSGISAIAVNTDAGEGQFLLQEERERVLSLVKKTVSGRIPVVCGLGGVNTMQVLEHARRFQDLGTDFFLVFPQPAFRGATGKDRAIISYHESLVRIGVPLIIFHLQEALGGVFYPAETIAELAQMDGVVAIKEATFDALIYRNAVDLLSSAKRRISILTGNDNFIIESFLLGADGALIGFGSIFTDIQAKAINLARKQRYREAFALFTRIDEICRFCFKPPVRDYRARIKEVLVAQGVFQNALVRAPLLPVVASERRQIRKILNHIDIKLPGAVKKKLT